MKKRTFYQAIGSAIIAMKNCERDGNTEWYEKWKGYIIALVRNYAPSGSGFDVGTKFDFQRSSGKKLIFYTSFHHMNYNGCYDGWTEHQITVRPEFDGVSITVSGSNRNDIKEYISQLFYNLVETNVSGSNDE